MKTLTIKLTKLKMNDIRKMISNPDCLKAYSEISHDRIDPNFIIGSVVWAKMDGYPWWPAMVDDDPNIGKFSLCSRDNKNITHYHVVFLDKRVSRSWVKASCIYPFSSSNPEIIQSILKHPKGRNYFRQIRLAKISAKKALTMNLKQRLEIYGFLQRYKPENTWKHESFSSNIDEEYYELFDKDTKRPKRRRMLKESKPQILYKEQFEEKNEFVPLALKEEDPSDDKLISDAENLLSSTFNGCDNSVFEE